MRNWLIYIFLGIVVTVVFASCANQVAPTGGPKDVEPPNVLGSNPLNKSTNFNAEKVTLLFDEYVTIDNPQQQVVISPPMTPFPEFKMKGKQLVITFGDSLRTNTTYTINMTAAVSDITEKNVLPDFQYVFSTGEYLDSFYISGRVVDAEKGEPAEGVLVLLYDVLTDSVVYKEKPYYFGRTTKTGDFRINNIKGGQYKLFAVKDENFNLKYDLPNELVAFWPVPITISDTVMPPMELRLFQEKAERLQLLETFTSSRGFNQFIYSMPVERLVIKPLLDTLNFTGGIIEYNTTRDTVGHWYSFNTKGKSVLLVTANDTLTDTVNVKSSAFTVDSLYRIGRPGVLSSQSKVKGSVSTDRLELDQPFIFELNRPAQSLDSNRIYVLEDTVNSVLPQVYFLDSIQRKVAIGFAWKPGAYYQIVLLDSAITDRYGLKSDSIGFALTARKPDEYGALTITIDSLNPQLQYVLEASAGNGEPVIREVITGQTQFVKKYEKLVPNNYKVRIIRDANYNNKWDTGSYLGGKQPERVYIHPQEVALKPNWEMELEIELAK